MKNYADLNGHKTRRKSSSPTLDALLDDRNALNDRLQLSFGLIEQILTDAVGGLSEEELEVNWSILADLKGTNPTHKDSTHV